MEAPKRNGPARGGSVGCWWRRRESNPRPQELYRRIYMLSRSIDFADRYPTGEGKRSTSPIDFTATGAGGTRHC